MTIGAELEGEPTCVFFYCNRFAVYFDLFVALAPPQFAVLLEVAPPSLHRNASAALSISASTFHCNFCTDSATLHFARVGSAPIYFDEDAQSVPAIHAAIRKV